MWQMDLRYSHASKPETLETVKEVQIISERLLQNTGLDSKIVLFSKIMIHAINSIGRVCEESGRRVCHQVEY